MLTALSVAIALAAAAQDCPDYDAGCEAPRSIADCGSHEACQIVQFERRESMVFISSCRLDRTSSAALLHAAGGDDFKLWVFRGGRPRDFSDLKFEGGVVTMVETNGGLAKQAAVKALASHLSKQPFALIAPVRLRAALSCSPSRRCPPALWHVSPR